MRILGIDPGLRITGYGLVDFDSSRCKVIEVGVIEPKEKDLIQNRINRVYKNLETILAEHKPDIMILEKLYTHYKHPTTACILGHVRGVICLLCAQKNIQLTEYGATRIKKAISGNGHAQKPQIRSVVARILKIDEQKLTLDASDALALALGHIHILKSRLS